MLSVFAIILCRLYDNLGIVEGVKSPHDVFYFQIAVPGMNK